MKVLFLDIDGVLLSMRTCVATGRIPWTCKSEDIPHFDSIAIGMIKRICKEYDVKIVLSSTWRKHVDIRTIVKAHDLPIIDKTPVDVSDSRGHEIDMWLKDHPDVKTFAIIDDDSDMLKSQLPFFVKTDAYEGMLLKDFNKLVSIFQDCTVKQNKDS